MTDKLAKPIKFGPKRIGVAAAREKAQRVLAGINPEEVQNKLGLILDDSGSMMHCMNDAHTAVSGFMASCNALETALAIYPLNAKPQPLSCDYALVETYVRSIGATGGTPLFSKLREMLTSEPLMTRAIVFSDGEPTDDHNAYGNPEAARPPEGSRLRETGFACVNAYKEKGTSVDTVYIGNGDSPILKEIAERTGGIYMHFTDMTVFAKSLKYLSPALRPMLMNAELKEKIQKGEL